MHSDYRIEKDRIAVVVTTVGGDRLSGDLFVQPYSRYRMGREQAPDVLNGADPFFPLGMQGEGTLLMAKDNVREVEVPRSDDDDVGGLTARIAQIEVVLTGGSVHTGTVFLEVPMDRPRLLDFLNRLESRFLTLHIANGVRLLNRRMIERVRPLD